MSFDHFVESLENVPPELERNFDLIADLDKRTQKIMTRINNCVKEYENTKNREVRLALRKETNELFERLNSYADDKVETANQAYELIDKNIRRLTSIGQVQLTDDEGQEQVVSIHFDMPRDPDEPTFCTCNGVSSGEMVACDNRECPIEWFHYECVGLKAAPKGKWYCNSCFYVSRSKKNKARLCTR